MKQDLLTTFLLSLEAEPSTDSGIDNAGYSAAELASLVKAKLLRQSGYRKWVICTACGENHYCEVHWVDVPGRGRVPCYECTVDPSAGRVYLEAADLVALRPSFESLAQYLSGQLNGQGETKQVIHNTLICVGQIDLDSGPLNLHIARNVRGANSSPLEAALQSLVNSIVLCLPSAVGLQVHPSTVNLPLTDMLRFRDGEIILDTLKVRRDAASVLMPVRPMENVFMNFGDYWTVAFAGTERRVKHSKGMSYLSLLLASPDKQFAALRLRAIIEGRPVIDGSTAMASILDSYGTDYSFDDETNEQITDAQGLSLLDEEIAKQQQKLDRAKRLNQGDIMCEAEQQLVNLQRLRSSSKSITGNARYLTDENEKARSAVTRAITRALKNLKNDHPALYQHLEDCIETGGTPIYRPSRKIFWRTE